MRIRCQNHNSSPEVIQAAVLLYVRCPLSLQNVEDRLSERRIDICHERWFKFGTLFAVEVLECLVIKERDKYAALKLKKKLMKRHPKSRCIAKDRLPATAAQPFLPMGLGLGPAVFSSTICQVFISLIQVKLSGAKPAQIDPHIISRANEIHEVFISVYSSFLDSFIDVLRPLRGRYAPCYHPSTL